VWRAGSDAHYLWVGVDWTNFKTKWEELSKKNLRLVDLEVYQEDGATKYAGVWRAGSDAHYLWAGVDWEGFTGKWYELAQKGVRLVSLEMYPGSCPDSCSNQVVMRDDPSTPWADAYNYAITATSSHCKGTPGTCGTPAPGAKVYYRWPCATFDGHARYARLSALSYSDAPLFTLPFTDQSVKKVGTWLYDPGSWHHAIDYRPDDRHSFPICAAAPGRVIFIGWDPWSGNTIIMSHDSAGVTDAFRTIYMHLRDGPTHDADKSWKVTVPTLQEPRLSQFKDYLGNTGCPQGGPYAPDATYWGTDEHRIDRSLLNKSIAAGTVIAQAGSTGPGGCGCTNDDASWTWGGKDNTHLHIFFARRDPTDNEWYFIDPYGIYGPPSCYPTALTDPVTTSCARYPVAWKGGKPAYS
jgi:hypothetical protein